MAAVSASARARSPKAFAARAMRRRAFTVANAKDGGYRENDSWTPPPTLVPQAGQKTALSGRCSPQRGQLGTGDAFMRGALCPQLQSPKRLRCTPAQRADELRVVLVGDLSGAVVELQLLQRGESAVAFLRELEPTPLELVRLDEPVTSSRRLAEKRPRDEDDRGHRQHGAEDERERRHPASANAVTS